MGSAGAAYQRAADAPPAPLVRAMAEAMTPDRRPAFPRGLVLGLTMAESVILIVFVLLLALAALLGRETDLRQAAEQDLQAAEQDLEALGEIRQALDAQGYEPEQILEVIRSGGGRIADDAGNWTRLVRDIAPRMPDPSPAAIASRLRQAEEDASVVRILSEAGLEPSAVRDTVDIIDVLNAESRNFGEEITPRSARRMARDAASWREHDDESGGSGTDHPSCWYAGDNVVAYLFDVALTDAGYLLQPTRVSQGRARYGSWSTAPPAQKNELVASIATGRTLSPAQFLEQTRRLFDWSVTEDCRFFVRAFDVTAADQKELYKTPMRTLESRFYKYASPSGTPPTADRLE